MARPGVTYVEVAEIANQLVVESKNPTIEQIRLVLGTGSSSTIAAHLKKWRAAQQDATRIAVKTQLPTELVGCIKGLWERVIDESTLEINSIEARANQAIEALQSEVQKYKTNNARWQKLYDRWQEEKASLVNTSEALATELKRVQAEHATLNCEYAALREQLAGKNAHVEELQRLHLQTQTNLEHYREAAREQRMQAQAQYEQQQQQMLIELNALKQEAQSHQAQLQGLIQEKQLLIQKSNTLEAQCTELRATLSTQNSELEQQSQRHQACMQTSEHWQQQAQTAQQALEHANAQLMTMQIEHQLLRREHDQMVVNATETRHAQEHLLQEKMLLIQEKAQLEGRLLQLQQILDKQRKPAMA